MAGARGVRANGARAGLELGRCPAGVANLLNPQRIVLGGATGPALVDAVRAALERETLPTVRRALTVTAGTLGEQAEVLGAIAHVLADTQRLSSAALGRTH